ncbi:MAG TPA: lipid II flippase MurJ [Candidatus Paceibacterota bacterium]|nr:lipid II flippase MurJ [Candidatus Paceibacterota bacterium]
MVKRLLERIARPVRGLHQAAYVLAGLTLASQLLALLRDRTFAHVFGASQTLDFYYAAFKVPDLVFALVSSLVSAYILIPRITGASREEAGRFLSESLTFLLAGGGVICLALALLAPEILFSIYPQFAASPQAGAFILLARILLIQPILLGASGVLGSVTQVERQFFLFALAPVLYNLGIILGTVLLFPRLGLPGIGYGVVAGSLAYVATNLPSLARAGIRIRFIRPRLAELLPVVRDSIPRSLALGMDSFTLLFLTALAARLSEGSVSVFTLAGNLENVPLSLIGGSYAVAAFPALSKHAADREEFTRVLSGSARHIILWSMVFIGLVITLRAYIVRVILGSGAFDWDATRLTAALLALFVVGLAAQGLVLLFSRALYAVKQSWRPFFYQLGAALFTAAAALLLLSPAARGSFAPWLAGILRVGDISDALVLTLAFAATLGEIFLAAFATYALRQAAPGLARSLLRPLLEGGVAAFAGGGAAYLALWYLGGIAPLSTSGVVFADGFIAGVLGLAASALTLFLLKNEEFADIVSAARRISTKILPPSAPEEAIPN